MADVMAAAGLGLIVVWRCSQATTQIQEQTLTFIPKIVAVFLVYFRILMLRSIVHLQRIFFQLAHNHKIVFYFDILACPVGWVQIFIDLGADRFFHGDGTGFPIRTTPTYLKIGLVPYCLLLFPVVGQRLIPKGMGILFIW